MEFQTAWITGATSGIGLALAQRLMARGTKVYSVSRHPEKAPMHELFHSFQLDLSDLSAVTSFLDRFSDEFDTPDLFVNNAGYGAFYEWQNFTPENILAQTNALFTSSALFCQAIVPRMATTKHGIILNLTSLAVLYPLPYMPIYNAAKSALSSLTHSLILEYPDFPKFIDFRMGDVRTNFNRSSLQQNLDSQKSKTQVAWAQIEKQLNESPSAEQVVGQILNTLDSNKGGVFYGGGFFQRRIASHGDRFLPFKLKIKILRSRYFS